MEEWVKEWWHWTINDYICDWAGALPRSTNDNYFIDICGKRVDMTTICQCDTEPTTETQAQTLVSCSMLACFCCWILLTLAVRALLTMLACCHISFVDSRTSSLIRLHVLCVLSLSARDMCTVSLSEAAHCSGTVHLDAQTHNYHRAASW